MKTEKIFLFLLAALAMSGMPALAAITVTPSLPGGNTISEGAQASVSVAVANNGNSAESNIVVNLVSSPSWFSVVTACSVISSLQKDQSAASSCIIDPTGTGTGLSLTATAASSGGTEGSGQISGITVSSSSAALSAQMSADSSASASSTFYVGVTVISPLSEDSRNVITTISKTSGSCTIDTSYASASQNIGNITKGTSKSPASWKVTAPSSSGSCAFSVSVTSDNTGSASPSKTVTITGGSVGGTAPSSTTSASSTSSSGSAGAAATGNNSEKKDEKKAADLEKEKNVPPGLVNNTKLQAAIEKVLAKGKLSESAIENLNRLADLIKSDLSDDRAFKKEGNKSTITEKIKYSGAKKIKNFMIHAKLPKEFAAKAGDVVVKAVKFVSSLNIDAVEGTAIDSDVKDKLVNASNIEIVEPDPEFLITFAEALPNQEFAITYTVNAAVSETVLDSASSQVYAESLEDAPPQPQAEPIEIVTKNYVAVTIIALLIAGFAAAIFIVRKRAKEDNLARIRQQQGIFSSRKK